MNRFIVFEGPNGLGKTTQAQLLVKNLPDSVYLEYRSCTAGWHVSHIAHELSSNHLAMLHLFLAARIQLNTIIKDYLHEGKTVILDRYWPSTLVHQCYMGNLPSLYEEIVLSNDYNLMPDLMLFFDGSKPLKEYDPLDAFERQSNFERESTLYRHTWGIASSRKVERHIIKVTGDNWRGSIDEIADTIYRNIK